MYLCLTATPSNTRTWECERLRTPRKHPSQEVLVTSLLSQYLCESKGVGHMADQHLPQLPIEISTLNPVQVCIYPVDSAKKKRKGWLLGKGSLLPSIRSCLSPPELKGQVL
jgi:hypothetical protein